MDEIQRFTTLKQKVQQLSEKKIRLEERHKNCRESLDKLLKEITQKGYDPTKLAEIKAAKEAELKKTLDDLEAKVSSMSQKIKEIEDANA